MAEIKAAVLVFTKETLNTLANPRDGEEVIRALEQVVCLLNGSPISHFKSEDLAKLARKEFNRCHFTRFLDRTLQCLTLEWISQIPKARVYGLLDRIVLDAPPSDTLLVLINSISSSASGIKQAKCINLLELFLLKHRLADIFKEQSDVATPGVKENSHPLWNDLITMMCTLSDRMANILKREISDAFLPKNYIRLVAEDLLITLKHVHSNLESRKDCSLQFLSQLFGRLCLSGFSDLLWTTLLPQFCLLTKNNFTWCRICERLVTKVPDRCVESTIVPVFKRSSWHGSVSRLLGDSILQNKHIEFIVTKKLLLHRHFEQDVVLQNIIGYLTGSMLRRPLLMKVLKILLEVWGDTSALKHTSYEQHAYISRAILVCLAFISQTEIQENKEDLMSLMMSGVQCHLDNTTPKTRRLGMIVAECLTKTIDLSGHKLEFEYAEDAESKSMLKLLVPPTEELEEDFAELSISTNTVDTPTSTSHVEKETAPSPGDVDSDLDSDDDLVPYDMSNDTPQLKVKEPRYLRDCMEGLISSEDPDKMEISLKTAEKLIRQDLPSLPEISVEFTKILLHLEDKFNTVGFLLLHHGAMVALAVKCPVKVAPYLTNEFFERNYNIRQRLDILEVLAAAAKELSQPRTESKKEEPLVQVVQPVIETEEEGSDWRAVVQKRIESKTRRFASGRVKGPEAVENKFAPVAGHFFFPLMKNFDRCDVSFDLLGDDCVVLSRLLYTLGVIMYAALHAPIVPKMAGALLEFLWALRYHPDRSVRRGILFALSMLILATPGFTLMTDLQAEVMEAKSWLEDIIHQDADNESKEMAIQALVLLENTLKQELHT
ncbi:telomere length regulation protein TEL2 homolog isoform X2 [Lineus longissimus]